MVMLDTVLAERGVDMPVIFRDSDDQNKVWFKPAQYYGVVNLIDGNPKTQHIRDSQLAFMISDVEKPFPHNCFYKDAE